MIKTIFLAIIVLGVLGAIFGALLAYASKIFHVEVDPKQAQIRACLAGANCGGCGYPGCDGYAAAVAKGEAPTNRCVAGGEATAAKVAEIMGVSGDAADKMVAFVPCSGSLAAAELRFHYHGPEDCRAAMLFGGRSNKLCPFACIGLGNCAKVCQFDAMHIINGVAKVDRINCVGCGACVDACPKDIVKLIPEKQKVMTTGSNTERGPLVMKACKAGCIGCLRCQRECPADAIVVKDNLARIDMSKCVQCGHCADVCTSHVISYFGPEYKNR